jgi:hypothetical protein
MVSPQTTSENDPYCQFSGPTGFISNFLSSSKLDRRSGLTGGCAGRGTHRALTSAAQSTPPRVCRSLGATAIAGECTASRPVEAFGEWPPRHGRLQLEHCAQKWVPVLRKNNPTTQDLRAFLRFRVKAKRSRALKALDLSPMRTYSIAAFLA